MTSCYFANSADNSYAYSYDNYGNRLQKRTYVNDVLLKKYTWTRGRLLERIENGNGSVVGQYTYDINGVRYTKKVGSVTTTYFYNGNTLLGENRSDGKELRYFYDATGLCGFSCKDGLLITYYTYVKDVLGNIVMIKSDMGALLARYTYDEWGNCIVENLEGTIGDINPIRYRGYYYDIESGLYYLMSRYYDPEIGQFISMDTPNYLKPEAIGGVDLYVYCNNNPVMYVDPSGHFKGLPFQITVSVLFYMGFSIASIFDEDIKKDMDRIGWNPFNSDEQTVINSTKVSFYRGVPVIQVHWQKGSLSLGCIFLENTYYGENVTMEDVLKHEYGHSIQLRKMGLIDYLIFIGIPSISYNKKNSPWELSASILGESNMVNHSSLKEREDAMLL